MQKKLYHILSKLTIILCQVGALLFLSKHWKVTPTEHFPHITGKIPNPLVKQIPKQNAKHFESKKRNCNYTFQMIKLI